MTRPKRPVSQAAAKHLLAELDQIEADAKGKVPEWVKGQLERDDYANRIALAEFRGVLKFYARAALLALLLAGCGGSVASEPAPARPPLPTEPGCYPFDPAAEGLACDTSNPDLAALLCIGGIEPGLECSWLRFTSYDGQERASYPPGDDHPEQHPDPNAPIWRCCNVTRPLPGP